MQEIARETLIKAQNGDLESFESIYKETCGFVYNVAFRVANNKSDAEEISQDVFLSVYHNLADFRFQSSFKTWIYRITVNCALNHVKKMSREKGRIKAYGDDLIRTGGMYQGPEIEKIDAGREKLIGFLLGALEPEQRACIVLRNIEGLSYREISDTLKVNINTVRTRLKRAREKLLNLGKGVSINEV